MTSPLRPAAGSGGSVQPRLPHGSRRPPLVVAVALGLTGSLAVAAGGQPQSLDGHTSLGRLVVRLVPVPAGTFLPALAFSGALLLLAGWLALHREARRRVLGLPGLVCIAVLWWAPVVAVSPVLSADAYSYLAQGRLQDAGLDPYHVGPEVLAGQPVLDAVDPRWRASHSPYGPVWLLIEKVAAVGAPGGPASVTVLRWLAVAGVAGAAALLLWACSPRRRPLVFVLTALNPVVVLHVCGGLHAEAVLVLLIAAAVAARQRGHPLVGYLLLGLATAVKVPAVLALVAFLAADLRAVPRRAMVASLAAAVAPWAVLGVLAGDPLGWVQALQTPAESRTVVAPTDLLAVASTRVAEALGWQPGFATMLTAGRVAGGVVTVVLVGWLLATGARRSPRATAGLAMLAGAALGPVFYPWYLAAPVFLLAAAPYRWGVRWVVVVTAAAAVTSLPSLDRVGLPAQLAVVAVGCLVAIGVVAVRRRDAIAARASRAVGAAGEGGDGVVADAATA